MNDRDDDTGSLLAPLLRYASAAELDPVPLLTVLVCLLRSPLQELDLDREQPRPVPTNAYPH